MGVTGTVLGSQFSGGLDFVAPASCRQSRGRPALAWRTHAHIVVVPPLWGSRLFWLLYPPLTWWAFLCRRFAARLWRGDLCDEL
jgi:hypothetical protein